MGALKGHMASVVALAFAYFVAELAHWLPVSGV